MTSAGRFAGAGAGKGADEEEEPLLAGELHGRVLPDKCTWSLKRASGRPAQGDAGADGDVLEVTVHLRKAQPNPWPDLIKVWYT